MSHIFLASPHMSDEGYEKEYIKEAFDTNWIAPLGKNVNEFENEIKTEYFSTCTIGRSKEHPTRLPHSQNPRLRAFASACASAFCSFGSGLLIQCLACIAINGMQTGHWIATAQVEIFFLFLDHILTFGFYNESRIKNK